MKLFRAAIHACFVAASLAVQCDSIKELYQTASLTSGETGCCENTHGEFDSSTCVTGHSDKGIYNRKVKDVSISYDDSLVLVQTTTNELFGFGWNHHGQIDASAGPYDFSITGLLHKHNGIILQGDPSLPQITVDGHRTFKTMAAGGNWSAAVTMDGKVVLWGNTTMAGAVNAHPLNTATSVTNVKDVQAGRNYLLVLTNAGDVYCFGKATHYQCGPMTSNGKMNLGGATTSIRAGLDHSMFIIGKRLKTCGRNNYGQLIRGTNVSHGCVTESEMGANLPFADIGTSIEVADRGSTEDAHLVEVDDVCGGMYHTSVNTKDGVKIFGDNRYGQFGNGNPLTYATGRWLTTRGTPLPKMRGHSPKTVGNYVPYWDIHAGCVMGNLAEDDQGYSMCPNDVDGSYTRDPLDFTKQIPYGSGRPWSNNFYRGQISCGRFHTYYRHFGYKNVWTLGDNSHGQHAYLPRPGGKYIDEALKYYYDDDGNKYGLAMRYNSPATSDWYWMAENLSPAKYGAYVNFPRNEVTGEQEKKVVEIPGVTIRFVPDFVNRLKRDMSLIVVHVDKVNRGGGLSNYVETHHIGNFRFPTYIDADGEVAFSEMNVTFPVNQWFYFQSNAGEFHSKDMKILNVQDGAQLNLNYDTSNDRHEYTNLAGSVRPWMKITRDVETLQYRLHYAAPSPIGARDVTGMRTYGDQSPDQSMYTNEMIFGGGNLGVAVNRDMDSDATGGSLVVFGSNFHMGGAPWDETVGIMELNVNGLQSLMGYRYPDGEQMSKVGWYDTTGPVSSFGGRLIEERKNATDNTTEDVEVGIHPYLVANYFSEEGNEEPWNAPFGYQLTGTNKNESRFAYHTGSAPMHVNLNRDAVDIEFYDQGFGWVHGYKSTVENADFLAVDTTVMPKNKAYTVTCPTSSFKIKYTVGTTVTVKDAVSSSTPPALPNTAIQVGTVGNHTIQVIMYFGTVRSMLTLSTPSEGMSLSELAVSTPYPTMATVEYDVIEPTGTDTCSVVVKDVPVTKPANLLGAYVINDNGVANIDTIVTNAKGWPAGGFTWLKGMFATEHAVPGTPVDDWWIKDRWVDVTDTRYFDKVSRPVHMMSPNGILYWNFFVKPNPEFWAEGVTPAMKTDFENRFVAPNVVIPDKYLAYINPELHGVDNAMSLYTFSSDTVYYAHQAIIDHIVTDKKTDLFKAGTSSDVIEWYQNNAKDPFYLADEDLEYFDLTSPFWFKYKNPVWMLNTMYEGTKSTLPVLDSVSDFEKEFLVEKYPEAGMSIVEEDKEHFDVESDTISVFTFPTPLPPAQCKCDAAFPNCYAGTCYAADWSGAGPDPACGKCN